ncbi:MAG: hypothetical protein IKH89_02590 [Bacteroidales bacterium]|nr:hypothetical protein [Bacteroidales bacterium]
MKKIINVARTKGLVLLSIFLFVSIFAAAQGKRVRTGGQGVSSSQTQGTAQNRPAYKQASGQTVTTAGGQKVAMAQQPQLLEPVEISGSLKTMLKSDYMTFCNIPFNLDINIFGDKLIEADFEYEDEQTEDLFLDGYGNVDVYSGIFPSMAVTAYVHFTKEKKVYRVELQTKSNSDENSRILFNNWHKRLKVYVDGGEGDNVEDPIAFSKSGPEMYYITFFPGDNCTADVKGWIILRIVYKDKTDSDYDENHSSFVTVDYIDAQIIPADVKAAWGL